MSQGLVTSLGEKSWSFFSVFSVNFATVSPASTATSVATTPAPPVCVTMPMRFPFGNGWDAKNLGTSQNSCQVLTRNAPTCLKAAS